MNFGSSARTVAAGAVLAAALGCAAGTVLRPELGPADTGPALIVSQPPETPDILSYEDSWWAVHPGEPSY